MKRLTMFFAAASAALAFTLTGCSAVAPESGSVATDLLDKYDLADMSAVEIIDSLDRMDLADRPVDFFASVTPEALVISDDSQEISLEMPEEVTYISIAPYVDQTHECYFHSLTTCQGELSERPINVRISDDASGEVIVEESTSTFDNGFAGFWLPRDVDGTIEVTYDGKSGSTPFSTTDDAASCITSLQVK